MDRSRFTGKLTAAHPPPRLVSGGSFNRRERERGKRKRDSTTQWMQRRRQQRAISGREEGVYSRGPLNGDPKHTDGDIDG